MAEFREDPLFYSLAVRLTACVEKELEERGLPGVCRSGPMPGLIAAVDCDCGGDECSGSIWVQTSRVFPSSDLPNPDSSGNCNSRLAAEFIVGIARCVEVFDRDGQPASPDAQLADYRLQMADMQAIRAAIRCCMTDGPDERDYVLMTYAPLDPSGGCAGGSWTVVVSEPV